MILVASDLHAGHPDAAVPEFLRFLDACESCGAETLVLLGDIFDLWRRKNGPLLVEHAGLLERLLHLGKVDLHYVVGNHDYALLELAGRAGGRGPFPLKKRLLIEDQGRTTLFIHGYDLEVLGALEPLSVEAYEALSARMCAVGDFGGAAAGRLVELYSRGLDLVARRETLSRPAHERPTLDGAEALALSPARHLLLGMEVGDRLVYGHTHRPSVSPDGLVANPGSWVHDGAALSYLRIEDDEVALRVFGRDPFP
ncbi:MAG TPA: metallophosphoesterase family protein [Methanoregulaceae archaeon]|nr:metallophosphoesterase family protein [Methanoregulaceae archaeon]HQJ88795.1 metallophosphoesterase family protein [Methanoregulaceae archaeon]